MPRPAPPRHPWSSRHPWLRWLPAILWAALIFGATASPAYTGEQTGAALGAALPTATPAVVHLLNIVMRKSTRVLAFGLLAILAWWALPPAPEVGGAWRRGLGAWALATLYAAADELHQHFVPGRSAEISDVLIDSVAALAFLALLTQIPRRRPPQRDPSDTNGNILPR